MTTHTPEQRERLRYEFNTAHLPRVEPTPEPSPRIDYRQLIRGSLMLCVLGLSGLVAVTWLRGMWELIKYSVAWWMQ